MLEMAQADLACTFRSTDDGKAVQAMPETRDEEWLTSWNRPPLRTTVVHAATEGLVWISGHDVARDQVDAQGLG